MSDQSQNDVEGIRALERSLERATASTALASSDMDPQTAVLREAWIGWGRLLETAETPMEPSVVRRTHARVVRRRLTVGAGIAAVVLVVGAATAWFAVKTQRGGEFTVAEAAKPQAAALGGQEGTVAAAATVAASVAGPKWNDSVDDEIVQVGQDLVAFQQDWHARPDAFASVQSQLQIIGAEIESADSDNSSSTPRDVSPKTPQKSSSPGNSKGSLGPSSLILSLCEAWAGERSPCWIWDCCRGMRS